MSFISYAQNLEDVMLWRALKHVSQGFYIDVGANDPIVDSVTKAFYIRGWCGDNIEPLPFHHAALLADHQNQNVSQAVPSDGKVHTVSGTGDATVSAIALLDEQRRPLEMVDVGQPVHLHIEVTAKADIERLVLGYGIKDRLGQVIYGTNTHLKNQPLTGVKAGDCYRFDIAFPAALGPGSYSVQTALTSSDTHLANNYEWRDLALVFNVVNINKPYFAGCAWIDPVIEVSRA